ncbi:MAG: RNA polymerase sigma factor WhiG [Actinomycetia bacterium]|nr:RNA polymerase sigma factor WhiG [Actinomycetes bacterium]MCP5033210.1 RNA polymerase sigma factor WhiG [Actinomycetes bacterium]
MDQRSALRHHSERPTPLPSPAVTAAARFRYLRLLGYDSPADGVDERLSVESTDLGHERPVSGSKGLESSGQSAPIAQYTQFSAPEPHVGWLESDGEWELESEVNAKGHPAPALTDPQTLAGTVAIENDVELEQVWTGFKRSGDQTERDQLIVYYAPLVKYVASRVAAGLPQNVDQSDLASYGMFGLIDAITKFDPERGFKFETYAISRIKGGILDELRSIDWVPRSVRSKAKSVERAMSKLESRLHRVPSDAEIAEELDLTVDQLNGIYNQISSLGIVALDEMLSMNGGESLTFGDTLADRSDGPGGVYERVEMRQLLAGAINRMNEREKIVLTLYYYESLTLAEIGRVLGVTESRVCQIHTKAVLSLKSRLSSLERELA